MPPFIIYSLGRSRTAWLTAFLTYGDWKCYHEAFIRLRSLNDLKEILSIPNIGILETAAIQARPILKYLCPELREVVILRPLDKVIESYLKTDTGGLVIWDMHKMQQILGRGERELNRASSEKNVLTITQEEMDTEEGCKKIFEFCLPYKFDKEWWECGKDENIQVNMKEFFQYYLLHREEIEGFKKQLKTDMRNLYRSGAIKKGFFMASIGVPAAIIGSGALGAGASIYGAGQAASAQEKASRQAIAAEQQMFGIANQNLQPYIQTGNAAENQIAGLEGLNGGTPGSMQNVLQSLPGYQFTNQQGLKSVQNQATARGLGLSGAAEKGAANYATGLANSYYENYLSGLQNTANTGAGAAASLTGAATQTGGQIGSNIIGGANAAAAGINAQAGAVGNLANSVPNALITGQLLQNIGNNSGNVLSDYNNTVPSYTNTGGVGVGGTNTGGYANYDIFGNPVAATIGQ